VRLACRFGFHIERATEMAIRAHANELFPAVAIERIWQEFVKGHDFGKLRPMLIQMHDFGLLSAIFPELKEVPLTEIKERLNSIKDFPKNAPVIASLLPLFPNTSLPKQIELCKKLKLPNLDQQFISFLFHLRRLIEEEHTHSIELSEWAYSYANSFASTSLQIIGSYYEPRQRAAFFREHEERIALLQKSIERIHCHDPIVKSGDLIAEGITPGKTMGLLLEEAERIAINEQIHDTYLVIERLKRLPLWPIK
jgi:poly(A) polymerase